MVLNWDHPNPKEALVLIHLSSLDSFTDMEREVTGDSELGFDLAFRIVRTIEKFKGPIFVGDQDWDFVGRESRPRARLMDGIEQLSKRGPREWTPRITWVHFDEQEEGEEGWRKFLAELDRWLKKNKITRVSLGGLFYEDEKYSGCVNTVFDHLIEKLPVKIDLEVVQGTGTIDELMADAEEEGEEGDESDEGELPGGYTREKK